MRLTPAYNPTPLEITAGKEPGSLGFTVEICFTRTSAIGQVRRYQTYNNVTEVHWLYSSAGGKRVALESDIHGTGGTFAPRGHRAARGARRPGPAERFLENTSSKVF